MKLITDCYPPIKSIYFLLDIKENNQKFKGMFLLEVKKE